ncbi:hypothetical protein HBH98_071440 [Parastagonospora nodorum]|nr:hypothetical protein HBH51_132910 [Parastagonospora nodorum]KAH4000143.1 hypothetical protein HBI10_106810 [Parastagonospora nodorum]KAH4051252.1 hypothetical protein HBH49_115150 [Parastagonospora nodorum]KAH4074025.1 hypothetical protein HBH50_041310 [Parastagonospora nodorum]KAH4091538.1 hypothetical protein HBH48_093630 [Parastagonospora nodorum]
MWNSSGLCESAILSLETATSSSRSKDLLLCDFLSTLLKFRLYHQQLVDIQRTGAWHMERRPGAGESAL